MVQRESPEGREVEPGFRHPTTGKNLCVNPAVNWYLFDSGKEL